MKGVSPMISTVILIVIVIGMAAVVGPWAIKLASDTANNEKVRQDEEMVCRQTAYDFDSDYGYSGAEWNFTGANGTLTAKILNTGMMNLYNFSMELQFLTSSGRVIRTGSDVKVTEGSQKTASNPLKPGSSMILDANITSINDTWTLEEVRVLNGVCMRSSITLQT